MAKSSILSGETVQLRDALLAVRTGPAQYDVPIELYGITSMTGDARLINAIREGNGRRLAILSRVVGGTISITAATPQLDIAAAVLGQDYKTSGNSGNRIAELGLRPGNVPSLGFIGGMDDVEGNKNVFHLFAPQMKLLSDTFSIVSGSGGESPEFGTFEAEFDCIADDAYVSGAQNEIQELSLGSPTTGNFTLSFGSETTDPIAHDATAGDIETALEALNNIGTGNVSVAAGSDFTITFTGNKAYKRLVLLEGSGDGTFDGTVSITRTQAGAEGDPLIMDLWENEYGSTPLLPPALPQL